MSCEWNCLNKGMIRSPGTATLTPNHKRSRIFFIRVMTADNIHTRCRSGGAGGVEREDLEKSGDSGVEAGLVGSA